MIKVKDTAAPGLYTKHLPSGAAPADLKGPCLVLLIASANFCSAVPEVPRSAQGFPPSSTVRVLQPVPGEVLAGPEGPQLIVDVVGIFLSVPDRFPLFCLVKDPRVPTVQVIIV